MFGDLAAASHRPRFINPEFKTKDMEILIHRQKHSELCNLRVLRKQAHRRRGMVKLKDDTDVASYKKYIYIKH